VQKPYREHSSKLWAIFYHLFDVFFLFFVHPFSPNVSQSFFLRLKVSFPVFLQVLHTSEVSGIRPVSNHEDLTWEQREPGLQKPHLTSKLACITEQERHLHQEEEEEEDYTWITNPELGRKYLWSF
jgi:hypothetical protein